MIKAILFDMDGVLIEAKDWHYEALNRALSLFGMTIDRDSHLSTFDGLPTKRKLELLSQTRGFPRGLHGFVNTLKQDRTLEIVYARCRPVFHHRQALSRLKAEGYKLGVCSNSVRQSVDQMMNLSGLTPFLDIRLSNEDVSKAKPDPEIYLKGIADLGLRPDEVLIVEDNEHGIQAARASGGHVMVVATTDDVTYGKVRAAIDEIECRNGQ